MIIDPDSSPPALSTREGCQRPMACPCDPEGPCLMTLRPVLTKDKSELEMPVRGE